METTPMPDRERPPEKETDDAPSPEMQKKCLEFIDEVIRGTDEHHRAAVAAGVVDPVVLVVDPAYPAARAIAEAVATPASVAQDIGACRRRGVRDPLVYYARPRARAVALLAPGFPATAAEVASRSGWGFVIVTGTALACHVAPVPRKP
jgi:hypothetical protein